jgi:hypothetical protein
MVDRDAVIRRRNEVKPGGPPPVGTDVLRRRLLAGRVALGLETSPPQPVRPRRQ